MNRQGRPAVGREEPGLRLLTFTSLFPNAGQPNHGVFVENRLRHPLAAGVVSGSVVAPVPWFPSSSARFGTWARFARARRSEVRNGLAIYHPRYPLVPRIGMSVAPAAMALSSALELRRLIRQGLRFDVLRIDVWNTQWLRGLQIEFDEAMPLLLVL